MAFGLPSAEQMRDYLISQGVDPIVAAERANVAARQNAAQAARTSALSLAAGAAPARAAGAAAVEAAPAIARSAMGVGERIAAAPRQAWEFLTRPAEVLRNPSTGNLIQNVAPRTGAPLPRPDLKWGSRIPVFTPAQRAAQGTVGGLALGAGTAGVGALADRPTAAPEVQGPPMPPNYPDMPEVQGPAEFQGPPEMQGPPMPPAVQIAKQRMAAAQATGEAAPAPMRRPDEGILSKIFSGQDYQSANALSEDPRTRSYSAPVVQDKRINWGDSDSAADFFRADKAMMAQRQTEEGRARGGAAGKPDSVHKALEIIHHLLTRGH
jgi:hypothetical protein